MKNQNRRIYLVYLLVGIAMLTSVVGFVLIDRHYQQVAVDQARMNAETVTSLVDNARRAYSKVLSELKSQTRLVTAHDHAINDGVIPNPATFSIELAKSVSSVKQRVWMYSYHPFPWRKDTAVPKNDHETEALAQLTASPKEPYIRILNEGPEKKFFYAKAIVMNDASCVDCHNNHPDSVKVSWKIGDTRAVLATVSSLKYEQKFSLWFIFGFISFLSLFCVALYLKKNQEWLLSEIAGRTDPLTKIPNRISINEQINQQFNHHKETHKALGVMMIDIDNFKDINDNYGHDIGDKCIIAVANALSAELRTNNDYVARWGGEEFLVLLHDTNIEAAKAVANRLLNTVHRKKITKHNLLVTFSIGIVVASPHQVNSCEEMIQQADQALLKAKAVGKNCYVMNENK
ncbi:diguanylate cyclase domain-containing protein [Neptunomonas japonica]|uniref:diguanylate cyclase domain-containing protein n=1 Tax=Neptunomonas japonica TaxID=417574 RepID=UPI0019165EC2|nr:diguanylate cyclase [Neptunomonas japonica]